MSHSHTISSDDSTVSPQENSVMTSKYTASKVLTYSGREGTSSQDEYSADQAKA